MLFAFACSFVFATQRQMEALDRGLVAVKISSGVFLSWRLFGNDDKSTTFNVYRNGTLIKTIASTGATNMVDASGTTSSTYQVKALVNSAVIDSSSTITPWAQQYLELKLDRPANGITEANKYGSVGKSATGIYPNGQPYGYSPNDCSVGDVDGDGQYEIIVKWDPSNSQDNSYYGITGPVYIDAYKLNGKKLWRISLGKNIRAGAHYTQFLVYDFDGDGKAEIVCRTAPGTIDGQGNYVIMGSDSPTADYRYTDVTQTKGSKMLGTISSSCPEYLTLFDGETGAELNSIAYVPQRGSSSIWGDDYYNRSDRFLACVAYLDGVHPSAVMCRGYYARATLAAFDVSNKKLAQRWFYDSGTTSGVGAYGQGNHNLSVGDVDKDGKDEIIYGSCAIDDNGTCMYRTGLGHGDAMHLSDIDPDHEGLEVYEVHEESTSFSKGFEVHDASTGAILWYGSVREDNGRGLCADIDATHSGLESWSANVDKDSVDIGVYDCKGNMLTTKRPSTNFRIYWDGDLQDELLDGTTISKWIPSTSKTTNLLSPSGLSSCNGTKKTPNLSADILGDWREEVIWWDKSDSSKIRIYTTTYTTPYRIYTLMHDPIYRLGIAWQNVAYNQPPHLGFYIGDGVNNLPTPDIYTLKYTSSIQETSGQSYTCKAYVVGGTLYIESESPIQSYELYNLAGMLVKKYSIGGTVSCSAQLSSFISGIYLLKVTTGSGVKVFKIKI